MEVKRQKRKGPRQEAVGWRQKKKQKIEIEKTHRDPLLSFNQAVTGDCSDFLGTAMTSPYYSNRLRSPLFICQKWLRPRRRFQNFSRRLRGGLATD